MHWEFVYGDTAMNSMQPGWSGGSLAAQPMCVPPV